MIGLAMLQGLAAYAQTPQFSNHPTRILVVGDSLSAEYGLKRGTGWVELLKTSLSNAHPKIEIINASISGDTTSGGRTRLKALLERTSPNIVLIELGANDALRGLPLEMTKNNLLAMVHLVKATGAKPIIAGMQIPPNYGREYTTAFKRLFEEVALSEETALIPFFLGGIAENPAMFQADTIHPNEEAQPILLGNVQKILLPMLKP
ncbi:TesA Lysophospholipase L1 and related esterases [Burkholderiaceae bacterium]